MWLDKPYPLKPACFLYPLLAEDYFYTRRCPVCKRIVNTGDCFTADYAPKSLSAPFRDDLSQREYHISGLCQDCQDKCWPKEEGEVEEGDIK